MGKPTPRYLYYVCPKCGALKEVEFFSEANVKELKQLTVHCWDHPAKIECDFVMGSRSRQKENKDYLLEMGDLYTPIRRGQYTANFETSVSDGRNHNCLVSVDVNCPKCMNEIEVFQDMISTDGDHGTTDEAVNCGHCDFAGPIRIRGLYG